MEEQFLFELEDVCEKMDQRKKRPQKRKDKKKLIKQLKKTRKIFLQQENKEKFSKKKKTPYFPNVWKEHQELLQDVEEIIDSFEGCVFLDDKFRPVEGKNGLYITKECRSSCCCCCCDDDYEAIKNYDFRDIGKYDFINGFGSNTMYISYFRIDRVFLNGVTLLKYIKREEVYFRDFYRKDWEKTQNILEMERQDILKMRKVSLIKRAK